MASGLARICGGTLWFDRLNLLDGIATLDWSDPGVIRKSTSCHSSRLPADVTGMDVLDESSVELGLHFLLSLM